MEYDTVIEDLSRVAAGDGPVLELPGGALHEHGHHALPLLGRQLVHRVNHAVRHRHLALLPLQKHLVVAPSACLAPLVRRDESDRVKYSRMYSTIQTLSTTILENMSQIRSLHSYTVNFH